jgi:hypothetical protein
MVDQANVLVRQVAKAAAGDVSFDLFERITRAALVGSHSARLSVCVCLFVCLFVCVFVCVCASLCECMCVCISV